MAQKLQVYTIFFLIATYVNSDGRFAGTFNVDHLLNTQLETKPIEKHYSDTLSFKT
jgi:hypothetical protein